MLWPECHTHLQPSRPGLKRVAAVVEQITYGACAYSYSISVETGSRLVKRPDQCPLWPTLQISRTFPRSRSAATTGSCTQQTAVLDDLVARSRIASTARCRSLGGLEQIDDAIALAERAIRMAREEIENGPSSIRNPRISLCTSEFCLLLADVTERLERTVFRAIILSLKTILPSSSPDRLINPERLA